MWVNKMEGEMDIFWAVMKRNGGEMGSGCLVKIQ